MAVVALAGFAMLASGCERELSHTEKTTVTDDGTVKSREKTVTEGPGNRTTVTEEQKTNKPGG